MEINCSFSLFVKFKLFFYYWQTVETEKFRSELAKFRSELEPWEKDLIKHKGKLEVASSEAKLLNEKVIMISLILNR